MSTPRTLDDWLAHQLRLHPQGIALGLERAVEVWRRLGAPAPARYVITVGGTNGKGSTVAMLTAMLRHAGLRVGSYTSPHLHRYNERVSLGGMAVDDAALIEAFARVEAAREATALTYFEFGTLAALDLFARAGLDVAVLEVGLGGRLDAVNLIDADVAVITTVDLDHQAWLGEDRDAIGREKAGIARPGRPVVIGEAQPPAGLLQALEACGACSERAGVAFEIVRRAAGWRWTHRDGTALELPALALAAPVQYANAAAALAALHALERLPGQPWPGLLARAAAGLAQATLPARLQILPGRPPVIVDVGHNPQAARALADWLDAEPGPPVQAVYGALDDKDVAGVFAALGARVAHWHLAGLDADTPRGRTASDLREALASALPAASGSVHANVAQALGAAIAAAGSGGRVLAFGSFFVAAAVLEACSGAAR
ncbi:MAG: bifunctional tetrahydrofolate synthase/dihydrofolate synthase [Fulvimonas sp.]|nr:bifunctional tetrahydrofolate synthase/dihydrofolate synthase [Fulvimonas sp.]